jgi:hypothetical protein
MDAYRHARTRSGPTITPTYYGHCVAQFAATHAPAAWAAESLDACNMAWQAAFPGQLASSLAQVTSSPQATA